MFFVTVFRLISDEHDRRCWGYFKDFETAETSIYENWTDIFELGYYNLALIEEIPEGFCNVPKEHWYSVECLTSLGLTLSDIDKEIEQEEKERDAIFDRSEFFGKYASELICKKIYGDVPINQITLIESLDKLLNISELFDVDMGVLYRILNGTEAPFADENSWTKFIDFLKPSKKQFVKLTLLRQKALGDPQYNGRPKELAEFKIKDFSLQYKVSKIEKPEIFKGIVHFSF